MKTKLTKTDGLELVSIAVGLCLAVLVIGIGADAMGLTNFNTGLPIIEAMR
ncbi:MAG: hypothetical protein AAFN79_12415 [Pseudomonadota bacterium]